MDETEDDVSGCVVDAEISILPLHWDVGTTAALKIDEEILAEKTNCVHTEQLNHLTGDESFNKMTLQQQEAMELALLNPLIVHTILDTLQYPRIFKSCRLVSTTWSIVATSILSRRNCCKVHLVYDKMQKCYKRHLTSTSVNHLGHTVEQPIWDLKCLNDILENCNGRFPCSDFRIWKNPVDKSCAEEEDKAKFEAWRLFELIGPQIRSLEVRLKMAAHVPEENFAACNGLLKILRTQADNVEHLKIQNCFLEAKNVDPAENHFFPKLKFFEWTSTCSDDFLKIILENSPNLQIVPGHYLEDDLLLMAQTKAMSVVKELTVSSDTRDILEFINAAVMKSIERNGDHELLELEKLILNVEKSWCSHETALSIQNLIEISRNSLQLLELGHFPTVVEPLSFILPKFPRLHTIKLGWNRFMIPQKCFPNRTNLNDTFPLVQELDATDLHCHDDDAWAIHFPPSPEMSHVGHFGRVTSLQVYSNCNSFWLQKLHGLCPNFKKVCVWDHCFEDNFEHGIDLLNILPRMFQFWRHLEEITLEIAAHDLDPCSLLATVCGISVDEATQFLDHCESIDKNSRDRQYCEKCERERREEREKFEFHVVTPSISELKNLKLLRFRFWSDFNTEGIQGIGEFCKKFLPNLKIVVEFNHSRHLDTGIDAIYKSFNGYINVNHDGWCFELSTEDPSQNPWLPRIDLNNPSKVYTLMM